MATDAHPCFAENTDCRKGIQHLNPTSCFFAQTSLSSVMTRKGSGPGWSTGCLGQVVKQSKGAESRNSEDFVFSLLPTEMLKLFSYFFPTRNLVRRVAGKDIYEGSGPSKALRPQT